MPLSDVIDFLVHRFVLTNDRPSAVHVVGFEGIAGSGKSLMLEAFARALHGAMFVAANGAVTLVYVHTVRMGDRAKKYFEAYIGASDKKAAARALRRRLVRHKARRMEACLRRAAHVDAQVSLGAMHNAGIAAYTRAKLWAKLGEDAVE